MNKLIYALLLLLPLGTLSASGNVALQRVNVDLSDYKSIQKGAKHYVTYCLGCHSVKYMRYKRIAMDLGVDEAELLADIAPEGANIYDPMLTAMNGKDSKKWFGTTPPDLSLIARVRGGDWLYTYLKSFYTDKSKPFGVNNTVFKDVGMPNMLWKLQGEQEAVMATVHGEEIISYLKVVKSGTQSRSQFDQTVKELVSFLVYVGEPVQLERQRIGKYVLLFFIVFGVIAYLLKKEYWKDIH